MASMTEICGVCGKVLSVREVFTGGSLNPSQYDETIVRPEILNNPYCKECTDLLNRAKEDNLY